jgi:hypothetical protein
MWPGLRKKAFVLLYAMKNLGLLVLGISVVLAGCGSPASNTAWHNEASTVRQRDLVVIDVRTPEEYSRDHVDGALNIPVDTLQAQIER